MPQDGFPNVIFCAFSLSKLHFKSHSLPTLTPQKMNAGGSVGFRKAATFNWMFLGAIFENLKYKTLSLSNRAGVFQQPHLHSAKVNGRSGGKGKTTLQQKKPKQLPLWYRVWPYEEYKNCEPKPGFLLMNFNGSLICLIPDKQHCCLDNGSWDCGGNCLVDDIISFSHTGFCL